MYTDANVWIALLVAGIVGCIATGYFASRIADVPMVLIVANIGKYIWSVIYAIPVPFFLDFSPPGGIGLFVAAMWLILAPTIGSKLFFGPKDVPFMMLNAFHTGYAAAALLAYHVVLYVLSSGMAG